MKTETIPLSLIEPNDGQIPGLPRNPRLWSDREFERLKKSIQETPEMLELRPPLVYGLNGKYVAVGGNMRLSVLRETDNITATPCIIIPQETPLRKLKEIAIKDNAKFGDWDYDALANEWADLDLAAWGTGVPDDWGKVPEPQAQMPGVDDGLTGEGEQEQEHREKIDSVEQLLNEAMRENVREATEQIEYTMKRGWIASFFTKGAAQAKFLRAKYYGERYPQYLSLYFCPERFFTSANTRSCYEQFKKIASGDNDGIAGLRTVSGDNLLLLLKGSYPFGGARMPMDFPANKARELIEEFGGRKGCTVLDPCHGWGGRLCGALMADVSLYYGVDPSEEAHRGLEKERDAFLPFCPDSRVEIVQDCFEDTDLCGQVFDMAITSPPYFDVEQYHGENQSHVRYNGYEKWVGGFYRPLIAKTYDALRPGGVFVLQVGGQSYPLIEDGKRIAEEVGFTVEDVRPLGGGTKSALHNRTDEDEDNEKIIILRK